MMSLLSWYVVAIAAFRSFQACGCCPQSSTKGPPRVGPSANEFALRIPRGGVVSLEAELGGGVVVPGGVDADVTTQGGQGAVAGLVGDGAVGGAAEVGVGDEAGAQAMRAVAGRVGAGSLDGVAYQRVHRFRVQPAPEGRGCPWTPAGRRVRSVMAAAASQAVRAVTGQRRGWPPCGTTTSSGWAPIWLVLDRPMVATRPRGCSLEVVDVQGGEFAAAQRRDEPDQEQGAVAEPGEVGFGVAAGGGPGPGVWTGVQHVVQQGWHEGGWLGWVGWCGCVGCPPRRRGRGRRWWGLPCRARCGRR